MVQHLTWRLVRCWDLCALPERSLRDLRDLTALVRTYGMLACIYSLTQGGLQPPGPLSKSD